jgi:hypothetical protein
MKDLSDYRELIYHEGILPPLPYTALLLWRLLPGLSGVIIQRLTNGVFYLAAIIVIYQIGKEIAGRRIGLYGAALAVVAKPFLYKVNSGFTYVIVPFFMALVFWATFRLSRKNVNHPFLWWGVLVGLLAYSGYPTQPFVVLFIFSGLLLVWWDNRETMSWRNSNGLVWFSCIFFFIYGLYCTGAFPLQKWVGINLYSYHARASFYCLAAALGLIGVNLSGFFPAVKKDPWYQWVFGAWLATLISFPILTHPTILERIRNHGWVPGSDYLSWSYISIALNHFPETFRALFLNYQDRGDMSLMGDPFFSYSEMILICLGLVFCAAKPNSKRVFLVATAAIGLVPHFFAGMVHSGLLMGCLVPFWLIAAVGLDELTEKIMNLSRYRVVFVLFSLVLILFWAWSARGVFTRVYTQWAEIPDGDMIFHNKVLADEAKGNRVYFSKQVYYQAADPIYEGSPFYVWNYDMNMIDVGPGEKVPNVDLYMLWEDQDAIHKKISRAFPNAQWEKFESPYQPGSARGYRCEIAAEDILKNKKKLLLVHPIKGDFWKRTYGDAACGLRFTGIPWQDEVADVHQPTPKEISNSANMKLEGTIHISQNCKYQWTCGTANRTILSVDGKKIFDLSFPCIWDYAAPPTIRKTIVNLEKGDHQVQLVTFFQFNGELPNITIKSLNPPGDARSLWSGFSF